MLTAHVREKIKSFVKSKDPSILVLRGGWGVGKTFLWRQILKEAKDGKSLWPDLYVYLSLFGISSSEQLKEAIALSYSNPTSPSLPTGGRKLWRDAKSLLSSGAKESKILQWSLAWAFQWVKDTIVCLDDVERRGPALEIREVLGIASILKDERNCKVVLILNDQALDEGQKSDFSQAGEKLFDFYLELSPSAEEAISHVFRREQPIFEDILSSCKELSINNIRTIQRIERLWQELKPSLNQSEPAVVTRVIRLLVLFTWSYYEGGSNDIPDFEFIKKFEPVSALLEKNKDDKERAWEIILQKYRFTGKDWISNHIENLVQHGSYDKDLLDSAIKEESRSALSHRKRQQHHELWSIFHDSFDHDDELFVTSLSKDVSSNVTHLSIGDLESATRVLRAMGRDALANQLVDEFFAKHPNQGINLSAYAVKIEDPAILERIERASKNTKFERSLRQTVIKISKLGSWSPDDVELLASCSTEDFYQFFKTEHSPELTNYVKTCLRLEHFSNASFTLSSSNAREALLRIADESSLNRIRVDIIYDISRPATPPQE
jgi:hypothetical protein